MELESQDNITYIKIKLFYFLFATIDLTENITKISQNLLLIHMVAMTVEVMHKYCGSFSRCNLNPHYQFNFLLH
jgi:hypothetical protein